MNEQDKRIFAELQKRKDARDPEESCDSCDGSGSIGTNDVCIDCLGQGVLLSQDEYDMLLKLAGVGDDSILEAEIIDG